MRDFLKTELRFTNLQFSWIFSHLDTIFSRYTFLYIPVTEAVFFIAELLTFQNMARLSVLVGVIAVFLAAADASLKLPIGSK